jgi:hypothetical protein
MHIDDAAIIHREEDVVRLERSSARYEFQAVKRMVA